MVHNKWVFNKSKGNEYWKIRQIQVQVQETLHSCVLWLKMRGGILMEQEEIYDFLEISNKNLSIYPMNELLNLATLAEHLICINFLFSAISSK